MRRRRPTLDLLFGTYGRQELLLLETEEARRTSEVGLQRVQDALRLLEHRLHTVVSNSPIVFFALERDGVFTLSEGAGLAAPGLRPGAVGVRPPQEQGETVGVLIPQQQTETVVVMHQQHKAETVVVDAPAAPAGDGGAPMPEGGQAG